MKYACLIYTSGNGSGPVGAELDAMYKEYFEFDRLVTERGAKVGGQELADASSATTVRVRNGERLVTDGPFAETKEVLGGFFLLDCKDLDEALDYASRIPGARYGSIEVRPVVEH